MWRSGQRAPFKTDVGETTARLELLIQEIVAVETPGNNSKQER